MGFSMEQGARYEIILEKYYRIKFIPVACCDVTAKVENNLRGYNEVMTAEIQKRYGQDLLAQVEAQAHREYLETLEFMRAPNFGLNFQSIPSAIIQQPQVPIPEPLQNAE